MKYRDTDWEISYEIWHKMRAYYGLYPKNKPAKTTGLTGILTKLNENRQRRK